MLDEIEKEISGDWQEISNIVEKEKRDKEVKIVKKKLIDKPIRPNISLKKFRECIIDLMDGIIYDRNTFFADRPIRTLFYSLFDASKQKLPTSFYNVWDMICNPEKAVSYEVNCEGCHVGYDVFCVREEPPVYNFEMGRSDMIDYMTVSAHYVHCPQCGRCISHVKGGNIIGITRR